MALVAAKCTNCGANIEVDESKEAGICRYCGTAFITEKAINNYTTNVNVANNVVQTTNINAGTVHIHEDQLNRFFVIEEGYLVEYKGKLKKVTVPDGVIGIAKGAFNADARASDCVEEITLPTSVIEIQDSAFGTNSRGEDWNVKAILNFPQDSRLQVVGRNGFGGKEYVVVPSSILSIAEEAFGYGQVICYHGSKQEFVEKYGARALLSKSLINGELVENDFVEYCKGVAEKEDGTMYAFNDTETLLIDCKIEGNKYLLPTVVDGRKITRYGVHLLARARYYETVVFPEGITALPDKTFKFCGKIKYLYLPKTLKHIGKENFTYADKKGDSPMGLRSIHFAEGTDLAEWVDIQFVGTCLYDPPKVKGVRREVNYREITVCVDKGMTKSVWVRRGNAPFAPYLTKALRAGEESSQRYALDCEYYIYVEGGFWKALPNKSPLTVYVKNGFFGYKVVEG